MKRVIFAVGMYISALVGAGFASGQETVSYFVRYGRYGAVGVVISSVIFGLLAYIISDSARTSGGTFDGCIRAAAGERAGAVFGVLVRIFTAGVFCAMICGGAELIAQTCGMRRGTASLMLCILCGMVLLSGERSTARVNAVLGIMLTAAIVGICVYIMYTRETAAAVMYTGQWAVSAVVYSGYNLLTSGAVIAASGLKTRKECICFGIISSAVICTMLGVMWSLLSIYAGKIYLGELPMLTLAARAGNGAVVIFSAVLLCAMVTTALSAGFAAVSGGGKLRAALLCAVGYFMSGMSFSFIVSVLYGICGFLGNLFLIYILAVQIKKIYAEKRRKTKI